MKAIVLTEDRMYDILPQNIKETDVISVNAKRVLASIMNYYLVLDKVKAQGYVNLSNQLLRNSAHIKQNDMMTAIQELIEYDLIEREVGKVWAEGQQHIASKYTVLWNNLQKPLKKKTFEDLFSQFLKSSETPMGTIVSDTVSVSVLDSEIDSEITTVTTPITTSTETSTTSNNYFEEFSESVNKRLVGGDEIELLEKRVELSSELLRNRIQIGSSTYTRCTTYLNRKYEEAVASMSSSE